MPRRKRAEERRPITVYPRAMSDELGTILPPAESGLSVEAEDIGSQFLREATEQHMSDWPRADRDGDFTPDDDDDDGLSVVEDSFEADPRGWERRITRTLRIGELRTLGPEEGQEPGREPEELPEREWDEVDLTGESIHEASLLDHEGEELGEVESPHVRTDDTHTHGRRRGGHLRKRSAR